VGRKSKDKLRSSDPVQQRQWAAQLVPFFLEHGIKTVDMEAVCRHLGVSKATLYKYFSSREALLTMALEVKISSLQGFALALNNRDLPYTARYLEVVQFFYAEFSGISNHFLADLHDLYPELWGMVESFRQGVLGMLEVFYQEGSETGIIKQIHPALLIESDRIFFEMISNPNFLERHEITIQQAIRDYFELRCNGLFQESIGALKLNQMTNEMMDLLKAD